ncbi:MAG: T9SS type A sorting domain-containing protein [Chlorobi bacterium]|nr:T9SS type A sorting domain-containing protein [Chlorobiota bacterium]
MNGNSLFCAIGSGDGGVLYSPDFGASWVIKNEGFSDYPYSAALGSNQTTVFAGLNGGGEIWKRSLNDFVTGIEDDENGFPVTYSLNQNYPNPFSKGSGGNPSTVISYQLPENAFVSLKVYDILGAEVTELVNKEQAAGKYHVNFSADSKLAAGVYFYRLQAGNFVQTRKLMLLN